MSDIQRYNVDNSSEYWEADQGMFVFHSDHADEMDKIRESVRRLVGEWQQRQSIYNAVSRQKCIEQLSALIDGKEQL